MSLLLLWAPLLSLLLLLLSSAAAAAPASAAVELWCVAKNNAEDASLLTALNWACGPGGADCSSIQQGGVCYFPGDVQSMASFAFNNYFLKNSMADHSCFFDNNAALTSLNPSRDKCKFPSSTAVGNGSIASPSTASTATGLGPSQDMSGGDRVANRPWFWLSNVMLFLAILYSFECCY